MDTVLFEGPLDADSLDEVARIGKTPDGRHPPLIDLLEEPEIRLLERVVQGPTGKLARFFNAANPNPADVRGLLATTRHWYAFFSLWTAYLERQGWNQSVDLCAWHTALEMGKSVIGMESLEEQVASLESVPLGRVTAFFRGCRSWKGYARRNIHSYLDGDLEGMLGTSTEFPSRTEQIIDGRNQRAYAPVPRRRPRGGFRGVGPHAATAGYARRGRLHGPAGVPHVAAQAPRRDQGQEWRLAGEIRGSATGPESHSPRTPSKWGNAIFRHLVKSSPRNG